MRAKAAALPPREAVFVSTEWPPHGPELVLAPRVVAAQDRTRTAYAAARADWPGINGIYDFTRIPQRGLDEADAVVTRWRPDAKEWFVVSRPGGVPL